MRRAPTCRKQLANAIRLPIFCTSTCASTQSPGLAKGLSDYETYGCTTSFGDWQKDVNGIAVGFMPIGGSQIMSINCGGPSSSVSTAFLLDEVRPRLIEVARRLES